MSKSSSLSYLEVLRALQRDGWVIVRQKGSHIRVQKRLPAEVLKFPLPPSSSQTLHTRSPSQNKHVSALSSN